MEKDDEINKLKKQNDLIKESDNQNKNEINSLKKKIDELNMEKKNGNFENY